MRKYKFDQLWLDAIALTDTNPAEAERAVRDYIETGVEPDFTLINPSFQAVWVLIRSQIDQRKERNARARLRRIARRESASPISVKATPETTVSTETTVDHETPVSAERTASTTPQPANQTVVIAPGPSQRAQRRRSATKSSASRFASRFRGPIKLSQTTIE